MVMVIWIDAGLLFIYLDYLSFSFLSCCMYVYSNVINISPLSYLMSLDFEHLESQKQ